MKIEKGRRSFVGGDDTHLTTHDIEELWEDFYTRILKDFAEQRRLPGPNRECVIRIVHEGPELQNLKTAAANADARLLHQNRPPAFRLDCQG